jgi:hypothetical protein
MGGIVQARKIFQKNANIFAGAIGWHQPGRWALHEPRPAADVRRRKNRKKSPPYVSGYGVLWAMRASCRAADPILVNELQHLVHERYPAEGDAPGTPLCPRSLRLSNCRIAKPASADLA